MISPSDHAGATGYDSPGASRVHAAITHAGLCGLPSLAAIIGTVARLRNKPIRLEQIGDAEWGTLTGLWIETSETSRIFVRRTDPVAYQVVCALHEITHILLGHPGCQPDTDTVLPIPARLLRARTAGSTSPVPGQVQAQFEAEAEYGARLLAHSLLHGGEDPTESRFG